MSGFGQQELQLVLYQKLTNDSTLMSTLGGVYDFVPEYSAYPYLTMGEILWNDASGPATTAAECTLTLRVFSRSSGRKEAAVIMNRLHDLLHNGTLSPSGYTLVFLQFVSGEITMENDGVTHLGVMRFQAFLQG